MPLDLETGAGLSLAVLPELILSVWAMGLLLLSAWRHRESGAQRQVGWLSLVGIVIAMASVIFLWAKGARLEGLATSMAVDRFRWAVDFVILIGTGLTTMLAVPYLEREGIRIPEFHPMVLFAAVGMMLLAGGADLFVVFLGLELMSISVYVLAGINRASIFSAEAALKYFLLGAFASAFLLYGIALVYGATGTTRIALIGFQLSTLQLAGHPMLLAGLGMLLIGFAFKVAAVPFHMWAPDVYDGSPTPVTVFMAASVKAAAFGALARVLLQALPQMHDTWGKAFGVVWWLAAITMVAGNLIALSQRSLKRMLAYSSVAHGGYLLVALVSSSTAGAAALVFYLLFYTLTTVGAFAVLAAKGRQGERSVTTDDLSGLAESHPLMALVMAVCMLSLLGFPGTAGFIGKWYILSSATGSGYGILASVLVLTSVVSAGYYLPVIMAMYMKPRLHLGSHDDVVLPRFLRTTLAAVMAALLAFGVLPNGVRVMGRQVPALMDWARSASHSFLPEGVTTVSIPPAGR